MHKKYIIGAHLSIAGGYHKALERIAAIGGNALQIFSTSPRGWNFAKLSAQEIQLFKKEREKFSINPVFFHASYLINLGNDERIGAVSKQSLKNELTLAANMGITGSVVHLGSFKNHKGADAIYDIRNQEKYQVLIDNISEILNETPETALFIVENAGNRKIGKDIENIARILNDVNSSRLRVCLDTCHLHAAGYDLSTADKLDAFLTTFDKIIGLEKIALWHINDSKNKLGDLADRHENIGKGYIGIETFRNIINHKKLKHLPFILEVPGFDSKGPDKKNVQILKSLLS